MNVDGTEGEEGDSHRCCRSFDYNLQFGANKAAYVVLQIANGTK